MKKRCLLFTIFLFTCFFSNAQLVENFENATVGSTSFTMNGFEFNLTGDFLIDQFNNFSCNGNTGTNKFMDSGFGDGPSQGVIGSITPADPAVTFQLCTFANMCAWPGQQDGSNSSSGIFRFTGTKEDGSTVSEDIPLASTNGNDFITFKFKGNIWGGVVLKSLEVEIISTQDATDYLALDNLVFSNVISADKNAFINELPIPYQIDSDNILLEMSEHEHSFNPGDPDHYLHAPVPSFAFNEVGTTTPMTILGPSLVWNYGAQLHTEVTNNIDRVSTTHWHGAHVPQYADGGPHQKIQVDSTWKIDFEILDKSATMWYHPHAIDITYEQVQLGLSGMIYVEDPVDGVGDDAILNFIHEIIPHDYNVNDFPLIFQTKFFELVDSTNSYHIKEKLGFKSCYEYLVNGVMNPYLEVPASMTRLRVLNGDGKFTYNFAVGDKDFNPEPFQLIATDAGYTDRTYEMESVYMAPGERTEWLLDLRGREGDTLYIYNDVSGFPNDTSIIGDKPTTDNYAADKLLLQLIVGEDDAPPSPIIAFPIDLHPLETPDVHPWTKKRTKTYYHNKDQSNCDSSWTTSNKIFTIDKQPMQITCVNDTVMVDSTEIWEIVNTTAHAHPFHIHDIHFWVIDAWNNVTMEPIDKSLWPNVFAGPKDNVLVLKDWTLQFVTTFDDFGTAIAYENSYMYHCHILPHEDKGMMGQFVVWDGVSVNTEAPLNPDGTMLLYPNPASDRLNLEGASDQESQVRIYSIQGQLLSEQTLAPFAGRVDFSIADVPRGMAIVEWITEEGRFVSKVLVQR